MTEYPPAFTELVEALRQLPSVGPRSAERHALFLLHAAPAVSERLAAALTNARVEIHPCRHCGFYAQGLDTLCSICSNPQRDTALWCIVEHPSDVIKLEKSNFFRGLYHVLGGRLSPLDHVGPEDLSIAKMEQRLKEAPPKEAVLALAADAEGETTALYLAPILKNAGVKVSRLAMGLPAGGGLEYADSVTLGYALSGRREL
ncbi:MAG: recombination mediator RecR [Methylacidiphilales bacterium]|nr:recombination mediator RecR [Candidatus Methylacidiphilales bacterium]